MAALVGAPQQPLVYSQNPQPKSANAVKKEVPPPEEITHRQVDPTTGQEKVLRRFTVGRQLGKGAFGSCYEAIDVETKHAFAAKVIAKSSLAKKSAQAKLLTEIKLHKSTRHVHVVKFLEVFEDEINVYIILELCSNMSMAQYMKRKKRLTEAESRPFIIQIISAVKYLHSHNIIHRDLKLANLLLAADMSIKLGDFGLATKLTFDGERKKTLCGTPNYIAPEILDKEVGHSFEVDIWAIGVILYTLLTGRPPFETTDVQAVYARIKASQYSFPTTIELTDDCKDLIRKMLTKDFQARPKLDEVVQHPWFTRDPSYRARTTPLQDHTSNYPTTSSYQSAACHTPHLPSLAAGNKENDLASLNAQMSRQTLGYSKPTTTPVTPFSVFAPPTATATFLTHSPVRRAQDTKRATLSEVPGLRRWVVNWHDLTEKYGLGYLLSDRSIGVFFNDTTRLITDPSGRRGLYIDAHSHQAFMMASYPPALQKKVLLLDVFRKQLLADESQRGPETPFDEESMYLKKWVKTKQGIFFILSPLNKTDGEGIIQVNFAEDNTRVLLHQGGTQLTYVNPHGVVSTQPLEEAGPADERLNQRLQYINEIFYQIINPRAL